MNTMYLVEYSIKLTNTIKVTNRSNLDNHRKAGGTEQLSQPSIKLFSSVYPQSHHMGPIPGISVTCTNAKPLDH